MRYEWSTPYTERYNRLQFNDFTGDTGISIPVRLATPADSFHSSGKLARSEAISTFPTSGHRNAPVDRNNWAPRLGFAYQLTSNTVLRGGAGVFYGMNVATNFQYAGPAFAKTAQMYFTKDNFQTQFATLATRFHPRRRAYPDLRLRREPSTGSWRSGASATPATWTPAPLVMQRSINGTWAFSTCFLGKLSSGLITLRTAARTCRGRARTDFNPQPQLYSITRP